MKMLKSKNIRRICVLLAMLAPVVYLFGSLFSALTGAHGGFPFEADYEIPLGVEETPYNQRIVNPSALGTSDWYSESGVTSFAFSDDFLNFTTNRDSNGVYTFPTVGGFVVGDSLIFRIIYSSDVGVIVNVLGNNFNLPASSDPAVFYTFANYGGNSSRIGIYGATTGTVSFKEAFLMNVNLSGFEGDPAFEISNSLGDMYYPYIFSGNISKEIYGVPDNSQYIFNQFFAKDNILVQIGKDVMSDNPHGFKPFAAFWKFLDNNMLHMGDMQFGLMGYGYVYYACHVLLFDIGFILVTFFLDFIQKVNDKVVGGVD